MYQSKGHLYVGDLNCSTTFNYVKKIMVMGKV